MNFEKIEKAYGYLLENTQTIQNDLQTNFYDALVEQNAIYLELKQGRVASFLPVSFDEGCPNRAPTGQSPIYARWDWISSGLPSGSVGEFRSSRCARNGEWNRELGPNLDEQLSAFLRLFGLGN